MGDKGPTNGSIEQNGWDQHKRLVLYRLNGIESSLDRLRAQVESMHMRQHYESLRRLLERLQVLFLLCLVSFCLAACSSTRIPRPPIDYAPFGGDGSGQGIAELSVLSWVGGVSSLFGIVAMVLTRGTYGMRAVVIGGCMIVLNFAVANFMTWLIVPVLVCTGGISVAWSYKIVRDIIYKRKNGESNG